MSENKPTAFEFAKAILLLWGIAMIFVLINQVVIKAFWWLAELRTKVRGAITSISMRFPPTAG